MRRTDAEDADAAAQLLPTLDDFDGGWRALAAPAAGDGPAASVDPTLERFLAGRLAEHDVAALADSPLFLRSPARLAYASAAVLSCDRAGVATFELVASEDFARAFAEGVAAGAVVAPDAAELLGSTSRPLGVSHAVVAGVESAAHRTTFAGATAELVVPVHVDLVVLRCGPRVLMVWMADAPDPFPQAERDHLVTRLARRLSHPEDY